MGLKLLMDEQINLKVAKALKAKGLQVTTVNDLGLASTGFDDESLLTLAISRNETLVTLDEDFPVLHNQWQADGKQHYGIFYGPSDKYQRTGAIGLLAEFFLFWHEVIETGAGTLEEDVYNKFIFIQEV